MNKNLFFIFATIASLCSCKSNIEPQFATPINCPKNISITNLELDSIVVNNISSSYIGFTRIFGDSIYFMDQRFSWLFAMDKNGKGIKRHLGLGGAPTEINTAEILDICQLANGNFFIIGPSWDTHIYKPNWTSLRRKQVLNWQVDKQQRKPDPNVIRTTGTFYTIAYETPILRHRALKNNVLVPIESAHQQFSPYFDRSTYSKLHIFATIDTKTNTPQNVMGNISPWFKNAPEGYAHLAYFTYDVSDTELFVNFMPDSIIYVFDHNMKPIRAFGYAGSNMDTDYRVIPTKPLRELRKNGIIERQTRGYYQSIVYVAKTGTLFRSYQKGAHSTTNGLQIYRNDVLIADIDVPKGFTIEGYIEPYYYSSSFSDGTNEELKIYRFKLN